ncbi:hypothetical protein [Luteimonas sp. YGD11-2]|uniref:hypothetical protein n=1 Tax=Luteimonas sp. YGD11-2 TaxID=2508168 RepID=UPI00100A2ACE|nr:hypothetical protein [Luteimonas sp. YGD11-2]
MDEQKEGAGTMGLDGYRYAAAITASGVLAGRMLAIGLSLMIAACAPRDAETTGERPPRAGEPLNPLRTAAQVASIRSSALLGDRDGVQAGMEALNDDFRRSIRLADVSRPVDREAARAAAREVPGVRSVAWIDRENIFAIVSHDAARSHDTIDAICVALDPLGDTLGVVVNLQSGAATTGDALEILSRNCQLEPGERAMFQRNRQVDVIAPELRALHKRNNASAEPDLHALRRRQAEAMKVIEDTTPTF